MQLKVEDPRSLTLKFTAVIFHFRSADAATRLYERGLICQA